jgi:hypothetical protein
MFNFAASFSAAYTACDSYSKRKHINSTKLILEMVCYNKYIKECRNVRKE